MLYPYILYNLFYFTCYTCSLRIETKYLTEQNIQSMVLVIDEEFRFSRNITVVYKNVFFSKKQIETVICGTSRPRQLVVWYSVVNERNKMSRTMHTRLVECINFIEKTHYCTRIAHYIFLQLITLLQCYCVHIN